MQIEYEVNEVNIFIFRFLIEYEVYEVHIFLSFIS